MIFSGSWNKQSATKWLLAFACSALCVGILSIVCTVLGLIGLKAQGQGLCTETDVQQYPALGKWDDGPSDMSLNWHVCERLVPTQPSKGWELFETHWYKISCGWVDYREAQQSCQSSGASLVSIGSAAENDFVQKLCGMEACWIGLYEKELSEDWVWQDGTAVGTTNSWLVYTNWNPGEPNNWKGRDETVAFMNGWFRLDMPDPSADSGKCGDPPRSAAVGSGKWFDVQQDWRFQHSICEKRSWGIGGCEANWSLFESSCYSRQCKMYNMREAAQACADLGSQLVSIQSVEENQFVRHVCGPHTCRIGLSELPGSETWMWSSGESVGEKYMWTGYVNWNDGEPNNWGDIDEDAAVMNFNDMAPSIRKSFLFQKLRPIFSLWAYAQVGLPLMMFVGACFASRCHSSKLAQFICIVAGVAVVGLGFEIIVWLTTVGKIDSSWPGGSATLLSFLSFFALVQMCLCCGATRAAQELQWATTVGWAPIGGVRSVDSGDLTASLRTELRSMPGQAMTP